MSQSTTLATTPSAERRSNHGSLKKLGYRNVPSGDGSRGMFWKIGEITCAMPSSVEGGHAHTKKRRKKGGHGDDDDSYGGVRGDWVKQEPAG